MKIVVNALLMSIGGLANVLLVLMAVWFMFAVLGVQLFSGTSAEALLQQEWSLTTRSVVATTTATITTTTGKLHTCSNPNFPAQMHKDGIFSLNATSGERVYSVMPCESEYIVPGTTTRAVGQWEAADSNFDNIFEAMLSLFITSSGEGWPTVMYATAAITNVDVSPQRDASWWLVYYFVIYVCVGQFFFLNLFVGVVFDNFMRLKRRLDSFGFLTEEQVSLHLPPTSTTNNTHFI